MVEKIQGKCVGWIELIVFVIFSVNESNKHKESIKTKEESIDTTASS